MNKKKIYTPAFYSSLTESIVSSAEETIPVILEMINPSSIVDYGCGNGAWLAVFEKKGINDIIGIDGSHVARQQLLISPEKFLAHDLEEEFNIERTYDLALCLEVGEHIPATSAPTFISSLCKLSNVILFSAAIPGQGGRDHCNEQYPEYWIHLFSKHGYSPYDALRFKIWDNTKINAYYRQNILFFVNDKSKANFPLIIKNDREILPLVHPDYLERKELENKLHKKALTTPLHTVFYFSKKYLKQLLSLFSIKK